MKDFKQNVGIAALLVTLVIGGFYLYMQTFEPVKNFPVGKSFTINENESLKSVSFRLKNEGYITSPLLFRAGVSFLGKDRSIKLGGYIFSEPLSLIQLLKAFTEGKPNLPLLSVTIPEGSTSEDVVALISRVLPLFSPEKFNQLVALYQAEGKLFPSTYFVLPSYTEEDIIKIMTGTFVKKVTKQVTQDVITPPLKDENDVLVLASILEGEAKTKEDMAIISGILRARIVKGMPLQVDVARETYKQRGLPSKPINNPGLIAISAALNPVASPYFYYITGNDGKMYYAVTFEEHKKNIRLYLK